MNFGRKRQETIYIAGFAGRRPVVPTAPKALEQAALRMLNKDAAAYFAGGAGLERTIAANEAAFDRHCIVQRMMRDVSARDLSFTLFGRTLALPLLLAPIDVLEMAHRQADIAAARAAVSAGIPFITSSQAFHTMEQVAAVSGAGPRSFQFCWSSRDELAATTAIIAHSATTTTDVARDRFGRCLDQAQSIA